MEFPIMVYPKVQESWDGKDYDKLKAIRVESAEQYTAIKEDFVLNFKEVTNKPEAKKAPEEVTDKAKAKKVTPKKQQKLEV